MIANVLQSSALALTCLALPTAVALPTSVDSQEQTPPEVQVGHKAVRGKSLKPFEGKWKTGQGIVISEVASLEKIDGKRRLVRRQVWPMRQPGLELHSELVLDRVTLATISFQQEVVGLPPGSELREGAQFSRWDFDGAAYELTVRDNAGERVTEGELAAPMFEGSGLGLVIAALPLEEGYQARLPVAMSLNLDTELATYTIGVRVVGKETLIGPKGRKLEAWVVEADWCEYGQTEVSYPGGVDASGGTYFVLPKPPKGFPHVTRYQNDGTLIDVIVDAAD